MTADTITTSDGRTVPLDGLEQAANLQPRSANASWLSKHGLAPVIQFDRETCLALVAEVRRLRERVAELEAENAKLRTLLVKHQWADSDLRGRPQCPSCCGVAEDEGHYSDCEIAAAIRGTSNGEQQS